MSKPQAEKIIWHNFKLLISKNKKFTAVLNFLKLLHERNFVCHNYFNLGIFQCKVKISNICVIVAVANTQVSLCKNLEDSTDTSSFVYVN